MGFSVKWVEENLGITREMLRYYEEKGLLSINKIEKKHGKCIDFSDEDIERIWGIKFLIKLGFSTQEIKAFSKGDILFDFDAEIRKKVINLEKKIEEDKRYLEFAKTIRITGRIPKVKKIGSMTFEEFYNHALGNWNMFNDLPNDAYKKVISNLDIYTSKEPQNWEVDEMKDFLEMLSNIDLEEMVSACVLHGYYQVICKMQDFGYDSEVVQRVVDLIYQYFVNQITDEDMAEYISPQIMTKQASFFIGGDIALMNEKKYGKEGCMFIAKALAYYGGCGVDEL